MIIQGGIKQEFEGDMVLRTLETKRLLLRNVKAEDVDDLFEIVSDEQSCLDDGAYHASPSKDGKEFLDSFAAISNADEHYAVVLKETNKMIGLIHLMDATRGIKTKTIGYNINKAYRRQGFAKEAAKAVMDYYFSNGDIKMFTADCYEYNSASRKTLESLGFIQEGIIHNSVDHPQKGLINSISYYKDK